MATYVLDIAGNSTGALTKYNTLAAKAHDTTKRFQGQLGHLNKAQKSYGDSLNLSNRFLSRFMALASGYALYNLGRSIIERTAEFDALRTALSFASGSLELGAVNMKHVEQTATKLGLALMPAVEGYTKLTAAAKGTVLTQLDVRDLFQGISKAVSVLALNSEKAHGTYMAFEQIMSKGVVSAEELRRQLGDRIPGAFQIAARAMDMTTTELDKLIRSGSLLSEDFLPKMARQLNEEFTPGIEKAGNTLRANLNKLQNQFLLLKVNMGTIFIPELVKAITKFKDLDDELQAGIMWLKRNKNAIYSIAKAMVVATAVMASYAIGMKLAAAANIYFWASANPLAAAGLLVAGLAAHYHLFAEKVDEATESQLRFNTAKKLGKSTQKTFEDLKDLIKVKQRGGLEDPEKMEINVLAQSLIDDIALANIKIKRGQDMGKSFSAQRDLTGMITSDTLASDAKEYWYNRETGDTTLNWGWRSNLLSGGAVANKFNAGVYSAFGYEKPVKDINAIAEKMNLAATWQSVADMTAKNQFTILEVQKLVEEVTGLKLGSRGTDGPKKKGMAEVLGGGNRIINIHIAKQIETFVNNFEVGPDMNVEEFGERIKEKVLEVMLEAMNEANNLAP